MRNFRGKFKLMLVEIFFQYSRQHELKKNILKAEADMKVV